MKRIVVYLFNNMIKVSMLGTMCRYMSNFGQMLQTPKIVNS